MSDLKIKLNDFACSCGPENKQRCEAVKDWAYEHLHFRTETTDANFLSKVVWYLSSRYGAEIVGIPNDPGGWSAVVAENADSEDWKEPAIHTFIQCDIVEYGLAFTLKAFYDHYGEGRTYIE